MVLTSAILIGVNRARGLPPLLRAENDARALAKALMGPLGPIGPGNLRLLAGLDATRAGVAATFRWVRGQSPENLLLMFAGHGDRDSLALADAPLLHSELAQLIGEVGATRVVVLLDTCHAGAAATQFFMPQGLGAVPDLGWASAFARALPGVRLLVAARFNETASEAGSNGLFTGGFLEALATLPGVDYGDAHYVTAEQAIRYTRDYVIELTGGRQHPDAFGPVADFPLVRAGSLSLVPVATQGLGLGKIIAGLAVGAAVVWGIGSAVSRLPRYDPSVGRKRGADGRFVPD